MMVVKATVVGVQGGGGNDVIWLMVGKCDFFDATVVLAEAW